MRLEKGLLTTLAIFLLGCATVKAPTPEQTLYQALAHTCPEARWNHATMSAYEQPLAIAARGLSPSQAIALEEYARVACRDVSLGEACDNNRRIKYLMKVGRMQAMVQAFCAVKPDTFD